MLTVKIIDNRIVISRNFAVSLFLNLLDFIHLFIIYLWLVVEMKKFTKAVSEIIIHCTATPPDRDLHVDDITRYHRQRGFETVGYHYLIALDGSVEEGRAADCIGAHCLGHNDRSPGLNTRKG